MLTAIQSEYLWNIENMLTAQSKSDVVDSINIERNMWNPDHPCRQLSDIKSMSLLADSKLTIFRIFNEILSGIGESMNRWEIENSYMVVGDDTTPKQDYVRIHRDGCTYEEAYEFVVQYAR